jgi:hypothetical protein
MAILAASNASYIKVGNQEHHPTEAEMNFPSDLKELLALSREQNKRLADRHHKHVLLHCAIRIPGLIIQNRLNLTYSQLRGLQIRDKADVGALLSALVSKERKRKSLVKMVLGAGLAKTFPKVLGTEYYSIKADNKSLMTDEITAGIDAASFLTVPLFRDGWDCGTSEEWSHLHEYVTVITAEKQAAVKSMLQLYVKLRKECRHDAPVTFTDPLL